MVKKIFGTCYIYLILLLMYIPVLFLIVFSFTETEVLGQWDTFSFGLYARLFQNGELMIALGNTIILAVTSAVVSMVLGTTGAIGAFYAGRKTKKAVDFVTQIPISNAEIVMALSLTVMFVFLQSYVFKANLLSFWTLLIGHVVLSLPFVYISVKPKLEQMDPSLYEAAIDLGATPRQALWKVIIPEVVPGIVSGFLLSITLSLDDFVITRFTTGSGLLSGDAAIVTLSTYVQAKIKKSNVPIELRALTTIIFVIVVLVVAGVSIYHWYKDKYGKNRTQKRLAKYGK